MEIIEAKKQLILRRRRLYSHYRQYEQWRRRQFSYDPCYLVSSPPIGQAAYDKYASIGVAVGAVGSVGGTSGITAGRRRRQYRRQFSCNDEYENLLETNAHFMHKCQSTERQQQQPLLQQPQPQQQQQFLLQQQPETQHLNLTKFNKEPISHIHILEKERSVSISERCTRSRINSAIFISADGQGFDSIEFLRRHGSQSVLCRKARSAENITDNGRKKSFSDNNKQQWEIDRNMSIATTNHLTTTTVATATTTTTATTTNVSIENAKSSNQENVIELCERRPSTLPIYKSNIEPSPNTATTALANNILKGHMAPVTTSTSNIIVGSISIETPPAHLKVEDSSKQIEESKLIVSVPKEIVVGSKPRSLVHQTLSNAGNQRNQRSQSFSSSSSTQNSPKAQAQLNLRIIKPKIEGVPMVSVSGPSPSTEKPPPSGCL